jgi:hypothetical protein
MKRNILLIAVFFSAFLLLQCHHAKDAIKELNDLTKKEKIKIVSSSSEARISSSGSETIRKRKEVSVSSSSEIRISSSSSEALRKRKEVN